MAVLDILVIAIVGVSMIVGIMRGFMYEAAMIFGWVLAFFVARLIAPQVAEIFANAIPHASWRMGAAFTIVFIAVLFVNSILAFTLKSVFSRSSLRPMDRMLGSLFGLLRAGVILLVLTLVIHILRINDEPWWVEAKTSPLLDEAIALSRPYLRTVLNLDDVQISSNGGLLQGANPLSGTPGGQEAQPADEPKNNGAGYALPGQL